ncbi:MAG: ribosome biogenesis GTPase Der [Bacilli bacterium]|nr:ribosome biogenesis GTPase Der [Bacilli bacterium]
MNIEGKVAIVGAPSTGKSTIFNRFIQERRSIVSEEYGITRDRLYAKCEWLNHEFMLIDTGGLEIKNVPFSKEIRAQVELAVDEADVIVFLVNGQTGVTPNDRAVAKYLHQAVDKKIILACNKIDNIEMKSNIYDFFSLGFGEPLAVSGVHGIGIGDLLDKIVSVLPAKKIEVNEGEKTFCFIGRPNVGKSSLTNAILGESRVIVSNIPGTTRDSIDTPFVRGGNKYVCVDTAGLKKRGKIYEAIDKYAAMRAFDAVMRAEVVVLVIDGSQGVIEQDRHVVSIATENDKPVIIVVNKWDLHSHEQDAQKKFEEELRTYFKFLDYSPVIFTSALKKPNLNLLFKYIDKCYEDFNTRVQTSILNQVLLDAQIMNEAPDFNGGRVKINYASQVKACPPTFVLFVNNPKFMHFSYERYLDNVIRKTFHLENTPLKILCRKKSKGGAKL